MILAFFVSVTAIVLLARLFGFRAAELLQFSEEQKADVDLRQLFG